MFVEIWGSHSDSNEDSDLRSVIYPQDLRPRYIQVHTGHVFCRNIHLKHVIEGRIKDRIEVRGRRGRRRKQLLDDLKDKRKYWKLEEEAPERPL